MKQNSLILATLIVSTQALCQDEAVPESENMKAINKAFTERVEKKHKIKLSAYCTGIFKVRAAVVKTIAAENAIDLSVFDKAKDVKGIYNHDVKVTMLDSVFRPKNNTHIKDIKTDYKELGNSFKTECWNVYENPVIRLKISNFRPSVTLDGKTYGLKYVQVIENGYDDPDPEKKKFGLYNSMAGRPYQDAKLLLGGNGNHFRTKKRSAEFPKETEIALESRSAAFSIDLLYGLPPEPGPAKIEKAKVDYNFASCESNVDPEKITGLADFDTAMAHNIANKYKCDILVTGSASNTSVAPDCNGKLKEKDDKEANLKLAKLRADEFARKISPRYSVHGDIHGVGQVNGPFYEDAKSTDTKEYQYISVEIKKCVKF